MLSWAFREELLPTNPAARLKLPTLPVRRLPAAGPDATRRLLAAARRGDRPLRDAALVLVLFDTGVRLSELAALRTQDVLAARGVLRVVGKGDRERAVPFGARVAGVLAQYQRRERRPLSPADTVLWIGRGGEPITSFGISQRLAKLAADAGLERAEVAPHAFRRGFAAQFLRNGGNVFELQQILGHSSLEMTRRYVAYLDEDLKAAHVRFSPGDRL